MRKLVLLLCLAIMPIIGLFAQPSAAGPVPGSNEVLWQLDSLMPCHFHGCAVPSKHLRDSLNKYNYAPDFLPPYSSDEVEQRLRDIGAQLKLVYNDDVQAFINLYILQRREQVERMLGLGRIYFPIFDEVLDREGLPMELRYLPVVESALNPHARSKVGATGLWQFMASTGELYGLQVTSYVDERRDPFKSTEAAVRYLKNMYKTYGDWLLVVAAYNCGPGNVNKAIARSGGKRTFWEIKEFLPRETRSYVPALIAATYVFNYSTEHNLFPRPVEFSYLEDTVRVVRQQMSLKHFADLTKTDFWLLKDMNPELKADVIPYNPNGYTLRVPMKTGQFFAAFRDSVMLAAAKLNIDSARVNYSEARISPVTNRPYEAVASEQYTYATNTASTTADKKVIYHKVRRGEVVSTIAAKYHVSAKDISKWNGLRGYSIYAGQNLKIYTKGAPTAKVTPMPESAPKPVVIQQPADSADGGTMALAPDTVATAPPVVAEVKKETPAPVKPVVAEVKKETPAPVKPVVAEVKKETPAPVKPVVAEVKKETPAPVKPVVAEVKKETPAPVKPIVAEVKTPPMQLEEKYHVVRKGDTLWHIASEYEISVDKLISLNQLPGNNIAVGQKLRVQ